jgi:hypothetical protein
MNKAFALTQASTRSELQLNVNELRPLRILEEWFDWHASRGSYFEIGALTK